MSRLQRSVAAKSTAIFALCAILTACVTGGYPDEAWVQTVKLAKIDPSAVYLGGSDYNFYGIPTEAEAFALAKANKGKMGKFVGYIRAVQIDGNRAAIEIAPTLPSQNDQNCRFSPRNQEYLACLKNKRGMFTSTVICHVNDWQKLNNSTKGTITINNATRDDNRDSWDQILVEGVVSHAQNKVRNFQVYYGGGTLDFGATDHMGNVSFAYRTIHIKNCRVATYRRQLVQSN